MTDLILHKASLTSSGAKLMIESALSFAVENGLKIAVVVVDREGALLGLLRMDDVPAPITEFAIDKAYTASVTGTPTNEFFTHIDSSPSLRLGLMSRSRLLVWGGGLPARHQGQVVGGVGVSGGSEEQDIACATRALEAGGLL